MPLQLNKYETAPNFIQLSQNLPSNCSFLHDMQIKAKQFYDHIMQKLVKIQKSTYNLMSIFGLIEENNMELSQIHLAVQITICIFSTRF